MRTSPQEWCKDASSNRAGDSHAHGVIATIAALRLSEGLLDHGEDGEGLAPRESFCAPFFFEPLAEVPASESATLALDDCCVQRTEIRGLEVPFPGMSYLGAILHVDMEHKTIEGARASERAAFANKSSGKDLGYLTAS